MMTRDYIIFPVNRVRKFFLNPFVFVAIFLLSISGSVTWYQSQVRHDPTESIAQQRRENLEDISRIATITSLFFAVLNWLSVSETSRKKASLDAVENFRKEYAEYCKNRKDLGIHENATYHDIKASLAKDRSRLDKAEAAFNSFLASCEVLCIEMNYGVIDEEIVKECLIGAFTNAVESLLEYIEKKQHEHPGRWINCLETLSRWHKQKQTFDVQATIEKNKLEALIDSIRTHQMLP